jgi:hypothetical protein
MEKLFDTIGSLNDRLKLLENRFSELGYDMTAIVQSEYKKKWKIKPQAETMFGLYTALCIDTIDPWKQNRVRYFSPLLTKPGTPVKALPFASAISSAGGFDDSGMCWVPPAGSTLIIMFENGSKDAAFYLGTTWHRDRGPDGGHNWSYNIDEYYKIHEGTRKGYLIGPNDGSQVHCQWNTENYNGYDIDSIQDFENDVNAQRKITHPNIYGFKTPQKHMIKKVDGDYKCNHKGKRIEILSSCGNHMIFKDDHLHSSNTIAHPSCGSTGQELSCVDSEGNPTEITECGGEIAGGHPSTPEGTKYGLDSNKGSNPYFKHQNECRPYKGPGTPQNNKVTLPQSGIQMLSCSGHTWIFDDSVEEPSGIPDWERSTKDFDFGCNDKFLGKIKIISATGHEFEMSDEEEESKLRGKNNYIRLKSACGNKIELNDHTIGAEGCKGSPPNLAGEKRGVLIQSTSNHTIQLCDEDNEQSSPCRKSGGEITQKAKKGFVRIRSGYGMEFLMKDQDSQEETKNQYLQIFSPQKDNKDRGPHILRFQEKKDGPGLIFLKVGGNYVCSIYDNYYTTVGSLDKNPADKITIVSKNSVIQSDKYYYNSAEVHAFMAKKTILLMAGEDYKKPPTDTSVDGQSDGCMPSVWPVLCLTPKGVTISDRVYVSASKDAGCVDITHLTPFHSCTVNSTNSCGN